MILPQPNGVPNLSPDRIGVRDSAAALHHGIVSVQQTKYAFCEQPPGHSSGNRSMLVSREILTHLVEVYFNFVHPQLRVLHPRRFLRQIQDPDFQLDESFSFLLTVICAIAARYSNLVGVEIFDRLQVAKFHNNDKPVPDYASCRRWERGQGFLMDAHERYRLIMHQLDKSEAESGYARKPPLALVQAVTLLSFAEMGISAGNRAYSLVSASVQLAYDLELDKVDSPNTSVKATLTEREGRRHVWWAICVLENVICAAKCRPRMINWESSATKLPCDDAHWFEGHDDGSGTFVPTLQELPMSSVLSAAIPNMAFGIISQHLVGSLVNIANDQSRARVTESLTNIEACVIAMKLNVPDCRIRSGLFSPMSVTGETVDYVPWRILLES